MRVGNGNGLQPTAVLDEVNGRLVEQADAVPQDVSVFSLDKHCALADGKLGTGEDGMDAWVIFIWLDLVLMARFHKSEGCEGVARGRDELSRFLAV